jgi:hypothetical protein
MAAPIKLGEQHYRRAVPRSINLEIRELEAESLLADISNKGFGESILFRIAHGLQHRVADMQGQVPRTVHVGWFHSLVQEPAISR